MKKLISITMLSAFAMLAAPAAKVQNTTSPAPTTTKKVTKKNHVKKTKTTATPAPAATPGK
jgi:hypothetical protein